MKKLLLRVAFLLLFVSPSALGFRHRSRASERRHLQQLYANKRQTGKVDTSDDYFHADSAPSSTEDTIEYYTEQCKDHDSDCTQKSNQFSQRYYASMKYYKPGGPIFMLLGGETDAFYYSAGGAWVTYAQQYNAATIAVEHRFYGQSFPGPKTDQSPEALKLLTVKQALQDYAQILMWFKDRHKSLKNAKAVAFGGSYSGFLAAWFRQLYPNLVTTVVASSAPLKWTFEFPEYVGKVSEIIQQNNPDCFNRLKSIYTCMEGIVYGTGCDPKLSNVTRENLSASTNICADAFDWPIQRDNFMAIKVNGLWVTSSPWTDTLAKGKLCDILMAQTGRDIIKLYGNFLRASKRADSNCSRRRKRQDLTVADYISYQWEICNELGNLQVSDPLLGMLGTKWGRLTFVENCRLYFPNAGFNETTIRANVAKTAEQYPLETIKKGKCIIFVNGSWDPWSTRSITSKSDTNDKNSVYLIQKGEHTGDVPNAFESQSGYDAIKMVQQRVKNKIGVYLNNPDC